MVTTLRIHVEPLPEGMWADERRVDAFEEMYRRCYPPLVNLCRRSLGGRGDPEAVAQEAFVRAWVSLDRFSGARPFWPWVATIARRLCIDHRRRLERELTTLQVSALASEQDPVLPDEFIEADEEYASARLALRRLKPAERRVITLRDLKGWSYDEIARFEGVSVESIRGSLKRARASLRRSYAKLSAGAPAAFAIRSWRSLRARLGSVPTIGNPAATLGSHVAVTDVLAGALAVLFVVAPPSLTSGGVQRQSADVVAVDPATAVAHTPGPTGSLPEREATNRPQAADDLVHTAASPHALPLGPLSLPGDEADTPEEVVFNDITASPSYGDDTTVFAAGAVAEGCASPPCAALFRSRDAGRTWQRLPGLGFSGGTVLVPSTYGRDGKFFVAGTTGLSASEDGGRTFSVVAPIGGAAAVSPDFAADRRILLGHAPGWAYRDDVEVVVPSGLVVPSPSVVVTPVFSPSYATDRLVFVGATSVDAYGRQVSAVFRCQATVCEAAAPLNGVMGPPALVVSPRFQADGIAVAWRGGSLFASTDGGRTFGAVTAPDGTLLDADFDNAGRLVVAVRRLTPGGGSSGGLFRSADIGKTWQRLGTDSRLAKGAVSVSSLPDGRLVVALTAVAGGGLLCSGDDGATWAPRCW